MSKCDTLSQMRTRK